MKSCRYFAAKMLGVHAIAALTLLTTSADAEPSGTSLSDVLAPMLAGLERTAVKRMTPQAFVQNERKDPYHARVYVECGLEEVMEASYGQDKVTLFQLKSPLAAVCALGNDKTLDGNPIAGFSGPQSEAFRTPGAAYLRQGIYFVRIKGSQGNFGGGPRAMALLKAIAFSLPSPKAPDPQIEALCQLPMQSRIPGSDRYLPNGVLGYQSLPRGYSAEYACGAVGATIVNIASDLPAKQLLNALTAEAQKRGAPVEPYMFGDESLVISHGGEARTYAVRVGDLLAVVETDGAIDECGSLLDELAKLLRQRGARAEAP